MNSPAKAPATEDRRCGSRAGYLRHHRLGERPCDRCLAAMRPIWRSADRKRSRPRAELEAPCGTLAAYRRHLRRDEQPDPACLRANATHHRERRRRLYSIPRSRWRKEAPPSCPEAILDLLETWAPDALTTPIIVALIQDRHPEWSADAIERATYRLAEAGRIERAPRPDLVEMRWRYVEEG